MIIEIKDIPEGKRIKHLSVDIDFTDSRDQKTESKNPLENLKITKIIPEHKDSDSLPDVDITNRKEKAIPEEMTDLEF